MTDEELDQARVKEALSIWRTSGGDPHQIAARLAREGWMPVDPLLIEAREICGEWFAADGCRDISDDYRVGAKDDDEYIEIALAALKRGIEIGKGKADD